MADELAVLVRMLPWLVAHPGVSARDVAGEFGITEKQVLQLVSLLTLTGPGQGGGELIDIHYGEDGDDIFVVDSQRFDRPMNINSREASSILAGLSYLREMPALVDSTAVEQLILKVQRALNPVAAVDVVTSQAEQATVALLKQAIDQGLCVDIVYVSGSATVDTVRRIEPKALTVQDDRTFARAWCQVSEGLRSFRVDRISTAELTDVAAATDIDPGDFALERDGWHDAVVDVTREHVGDFDRTTIMSMTGMGDRQRLVVKVATWEWLARVVLMAGGGIRIVEPAEGRAAVQRAAQAFAARNSG